MASTNHTRAVSRHKNSSSSSLAGVIDGAESLLAATANLGEEKLEGLRSTLEADLDAARRQLERLEGKIVERANGVDEYVHENPWQAIGIAAAAGVIVGAIAFRR